MKNITEILKEVGVEIPADKQAAFETAFNENYKTVAEMEKKTKSLEAKEAECKNLTAQLETANNTIKSFEGEDIEGLKIKIKEYEDTLEKERAAHEKERADREFKDALDEKLKDIKFTSEYAKKAVTEEIMAAGLKVIDGKIIGFDDLLNAIKEKDKSAIVDEEMQQLEGNRVKFTKPLNIPAGTKLSTAELMKLKNQYPDMDISKYM